MNSAELAEKALSQIDAADGDFSPPELLERFKRNAGRAMQEIVAQRLQASGTPLDQQKGSRYRWGEGIILNRNSRVGVGFWSNMPRSQLDDLRQVMSEHSAIFLFCFFQIAENPAGFTSNALRECNRLLEDRGISPEQQIGHALFMVQTFGNESQASEDKPLIAQALRRIVRYSVLPYVRELCMMQFGRPDRTLTSQIESILLECVSSTQEPDDETDTEPIDSGDSN